MVFYNSPAAEIIYIGSIREAICSLWGDGKQVPQGYDGSIWSTLTLEVKS